MVVVLGGTQPHKAQPAMSGQSRDGGKHVDAEFGRGALNVAREPLLGFGVRTTASQAADWALCRIARLLVTRVRDTAYAGLAGTVRLGIRAC